MTCKNRRGTSTFRFICSKNLLIFLAYNIWFKAVVFLQNYNLAAYSFSAFRIRSFGCPRKCESIKCFRRKSLKAIERSTEQQEKDRLSSMIPKHIGFICDGNSRWAKARFLPDAAGHAAGADRLINCLSSLQKHGIQYCTMYAFSTENWKRDRNEIRNILTVIEQTARSSRVLNKSNIKVKILGDLYDDRIPSSLREALHSLEEKTNKNVTEKDKEEARRSEEYLTVCLAINYGGRQDIMKASIKMAKEILDGKLDLEQVSESDFGSLLYTHDIPDPDLIVRTGGERRLSNFLLWDIAYSEIFFTDTLWPDYNEVELNNTLNWFASRSRRFGGR